MIQPPYYPYKNESEYAHGHDVFFFLLTMPQVTFIPLNKTVSATAGAELVDSARRAGVNIETPCGAKGACGKCVVRIVSGSVDTDSLGKLSK